MRSVIYPVTALLLGLAILLVGNGMLAILLGLVAGEVFGGALAGIVMGGYFVGWVAGSYCIPAIIRSVGHIRTFAALAALASVVAAAHGALVDPLAWWLLRLLSGGCLVGIYLVVESWLNEQTHNTLRGRVFGVYMTITLVALGTGLLLGPLVASPSSLAPFVLASVLFTLGLIPVAVTPMVQPQPPPVLSTGVRRLFAASPTGFLGASISGIVNGILWGLGPAYWRGIGLSEVETALFMALVIAGGASLQWPIGHLSDGRDRRPVLAAVCVAAAAAALATLGAPLIPRPLLAVCAFGYGGFMLTIYSLSVAHVNDRVGPSGMLEAVRTLLLLYGIGAALGPMAAGFFLEHFGPAALPVFSACVLAILAAAIVKEIATKPVALAELQAHFVPLTRTSQASMEMLQDATQASPEK
jgi:MFS family permease